MRDARDYQMEPCDPDEPEYITVHESFLSEVLRETDPLYRPGVEHRQQTAITGLANALRDVEKLTGSKVGVGVLNDFIEAAREVVDAWDVPTPDRDSTTDVNRTLLEALVKYHEDSDPVDDHDVGMCACGVLELLREMRLALKGEHTCRECGGGGFVWDQEEHNREAARMQEKYPDEDVGGEYGFVKCPTCDGKCVVRIGS